MLILGIILILVGALVWHFFGAERFLQFAAALLVAIGIVLVLIGALDAADVGWHGH